MTTDLSERLLSLLLLALCRSRLRSLETKMCVLRWIFQKDWKLQNLKLHLCDLHAGNFGNF